jgi:mannose-6-phosphate isomerase-like protein (cupin superfamily)
MFETRRLPGKADVIAPDGSMVRILLQLHGESMAHFELAPGKISRSVFHRNVDEIWYFLSGQGEFWLKIEAREDVVRVEAGVCLSIPSGTVFQFRSLGAEPLTAVAVTMPPWPGPEEAVEVQGHWISTE